MFRSLVSKKTNHVLINIAPKPLFRNCAIYNPFKTSKHNTILAQISKQTTDSLFLQEASLCRKYHSDQVGENVKEDIDSEVPVTEYNIHGKKVERDYLSEENPKVYNEDVHCRTHSLVRAYRTFGHLEATIDPLGLLQPKKNTIELRPSLYNLKNLYYGDEDIKVDIENTVHIGDRSKPKRYGSIKEIVEHCRKVYSHNIAAQFMHLDSSKEILWIAKSLEFASSSAISSETIKLVQKQMHHSELFDHFLGKKYPTLKRYGLEGSESFLPALDHTLRRFSEHNVEEIVIGMPHRGRLNILTEVLNYPPRALFHKIMGNSEIPDKMYGTGDVLSHIGISSRLKFGNKKIDVSLINNPSHLEAVDPVALGKTRAKQDKGSKSACILVHGDSAICAQGIVTETLAFSNLKHFSTGGTVHIIVNNQLGFTTPPEFYRSTRYSADIGKMVGTPTFTVNGERIEDVIKVIEIAVDYRTKFKKDVIVEIVAYRRHGHNELDEPAFTQPKMYHVVRNKESYPSIFNKKLLKMNLLTEDQLTEQKQRFERNLNIEYDYSKNYHPEKRYFLGDWDGILQGHNISKFEAPVTGIDVERLKDIALQSIKLPEEFDVHERLKKFHIAKRRNLIEEHLPIDWATAESGALGSLVQEGYNVRLSGEDSARGTFSQRHFEFIDQTTEEKVYPLDSLKDKKGRLFVVSTPLSELAVLGYEYGYSINDPKNLVIWEAQFGDFFNGAQIIIDQFIASGEDKWCLCSGLVLLLPHGMDGMGPEHSSCKYERFLQLCTGDVESNEMGQEHLNMYLINPTTPANYFHALRRQMHFKFRKPLVVVAPKALLRSKEATSPWEDFQEGTQFQPVLNDSIEPTQNLKRLIICSGKAYYELVQRRKSLNLEDKVYILRLEELSPFPFKILHEKVQKIIESGAKIESLVYFQEEHENQGGYYFCKPRIERFTLDQLGLKKLEYVGRKSSSTSASGIAKEHKEQHEHIYSKVFENI